jgi:methyltransferase (TIGR00027 family)
LDGFKIELLRSSIIFPASLCAFLSPQAVSRIENEMKKLAFSNSLKVAERRYIQSIHERSHLQNPDRLVGQFLPLLRRLRCRWLSRSALAALQADSLYYYLLARTRYYDSVFLDAIGDNVHYIINIGCGTDTRAHRFEQVLKQKDVKVLECDQPKAIQIKQGLAKRVGSNGHVTYLSVDLNDNIWAAFEDWLEKHKMVKALVFMEGVSPYIKSEKFKEFLVLLAKNLSSGSRVAYDFKLRGFDEFDRAGRPQRLFRLGERKEELAAFHEEIGYQLDHMEGSADLTTRLLGGVSMSRGHLFKEDVLIQLEVMR